MLKGIEVSLLMADASYGTHTKSVALLVFKGKQ